MRSTNVFWLPFTIFFLSFLPFSPHQKVFAFFYLFLFTYFNYFIIYYSEMWEKNVSRSGKIFVCGCCACFYSTSISSLA